MKRLIVLVLAFSLFLSLGAPAWSQETNDVDEVSEDRLQQRQEVREQNQERRQGVRCLVAGVHGRRLQHRFKVYYRRLTHLAAKLQNRIDRLAENNVGMSEAQGLLDEAMVKLEEARTMGDEATANFGQIEEGDCAQLRDQALAARDLALEARELFKEIVELLKEVFSLVRAESGNL